MVGQAILAAVVIAVSAALWRAVVVIRRLARNDPASIPRFARRVLRIPDQPHDSVVSFSRRRPGRRVAFIINPTKPGLAQLHEAAYRACSLRHLPEPIWLYTSLEDAGTEVARDAILAGAEVLIAAGGDGTVRAVATAAADAGLPLGVIPSGTGNLLARNLGLPLRDMRLALRIALDGVDTPTDIGWLSVTRESGESVEYPFLVIAGIGLDAEMVAGARSSLKSYIGWMAYFVAAMKHIGSSRMKASVKIDDREPIDQRMRTVLIANCGLLPGGVLLIPDARIDDGMLDVAILDSRGGIAGWTQLAGEVWLQGVRITTPTLPDAWRVGRIDHARGLNVDVHTETPRRIQIDGESLGRAVHIHARIEPGAVRIRTLARTPRRGIGRPSKDKPPSVERRRRPSPAINPNDGRRVG